MNGFSKQSSRPIKSLNEKKQGGGTNGEPYDDYAITIHIPTNKQQATTRGRVKNKKNSRVGLTPRNLFCDMPMMDRMAFTIEGGWTECLLTAWDVLSYGKDIMT